MLPLVQSIQPELDLPATSRVENSDRDRDESYSPSDRKPARGSEDDASEDAVHKDKIEALTEEDLTEPLGQQSPKHLNNQISFFA